MRILCVAFATAVLALSFSCKQESKSAALSEKPKALPVSRDYQQGPVHVRILADKDSLTIAENLSLTIEADTKDGYEVKLPSFSEKLGEFGIVDYREEPPKLSAEGRFVSRKVYKLEPFLAGDYKIPSMTIAFGKKQDEGQTQENRENPEKSGVKTDEIVIKVRSLLGEDQKDLQIQSIFDPVELPARLPPLWYILVGVGLAAVFGAGGFYWFKHRKSASTITQKPPKAHELAYRQLDELLGEKLAERGEFKLFFARISDILRYYIENRFGLHAPKRTTEEFLAVLGHSRQAHFPIEHQMLLDNFLHHCDLVKFAEHLPTLEEVGKAVDACKAFIEATIPVEPITDGGKRVER